MPVKKRVFLGLVSATVLVALALAGTVWVLSRSGLWGRAVLLFTSWLGFMLAVLSAAGLLGIVLTVWRGRPVGLAPFIRLVLEFFYPLSLRLGPLVGIGKEQVQTSFVAVNNALAKAGAGQVRPGDALLLVPHCLQRTDCAHRITVDAGNCRRCGRCQVGEVVALARRHGIRLAVATGGGMARKLIHDLRPEAVIAVACERDLISGLLETYPLPVYGIVNERPHGYCVNTGVSLERIEAALELFLSASRNTQ